MHMPIGAQFVHRRGLGLDIEGKSSWLFPSGDRFDERSGRKFAVSDRTDTRADDGSSFGVCDPELEIPIGWVG